MKRQWLQAPDGTAHYSGGFDRWQMRSLCGVTDKYVVIKEPKQHQKWCQRCTDMEAK